MILLYDSKCSLCRNLAYKIHFLSNEEVRIQALTSPESQKTLEQFYPGGWSHDFYVIQNGTCRKGVRALPSLLSALGPKRMGSVLADYGHARLSKLRPSTCAQATAGSDPSKRNFLKLAALSPLLYGFSRIRGGDPFEDPERGPMNGFLVNVAEVEGDGHHFIAKAYRCESCRRAAFKERRLEPGLTTRLIENATLAEQPLSKLSLNGSGDPRLKIKRVEYEAERVRNGQRSSAQMIVYAGLLDHPLYGLSVSFAQSQKSAVVGMARHDVPAPVLDFITFKTEGDSVDAYFAAYAQGVHELERLHAGEGRSELVQVYREIRQGLLAIPASLREAVGDSLLPARNELLLTSMPEGLRFYQSPFFQEKESGGCDCSCGCSACCGCGCTLGICVSPLPCDCDCCLGCGCGCGCCLPSAI